MEIKPTLAPESGSLQKRNQSSKLSPQRVRPSSSHRARRAMGLYDVPADATVYAPSDENVEAHPPDLARRKARTGVRGTRSDCASEHGGSSLARQPPIRISI